MNDNKLPADSSATTLGIISLSILIIGFCCGPIAIVALVLSIIGLVNANRSIKLYNQIPENYSNQSYKSVTTGKILNIIAIPISGLISLFWIAYYLIYGAAVLSILTLFSEAAKEVERERIESDYYNQDIDSIYNSDEDVYILEEERFSLDSLSN
ncbi:MAG: CCC motif membrane protein [Flavobacteriaceae bacterium]